MCDPSAVQSESVGDGTTAPFVGREVMAPDGRLANLKLTPQWPQSISVLSPRPEPEKGEPHGAATLLRVPRGAPNRSESGQLCISWAVFLPVSDASDISIPVDGRALGRFHLLLHGYFFLDSGRRRIEGLDTPAENGDPTDASGLRRAWNAELRDAVVLPLLPTLLRDALDSAMVTSAELGQLVSALARHEWFKENRRAICRERALVRLFEPSSGIVWRTLPSRDAMRPLPASVADAPRRIEELFGSISSWAEASHVRLIVDDSAALSAEPLHWGAADLKSLFTGLSPRVFQSRDLARLLVDFLDAVTPGDAERSAFRPHIVAALRTAMKDTPALASFALMKSIIAFVPPAALFPLPTSVENRQVLRALASAPSDILPVRSEWLDDGRRPPQVSSSDLKALLKGLEPLIEGDQADQAATAALALLAQAERNISELARDPDFASIKVLRVRDVRISGPIVLSLQALVKRSRAGLLFSSSPQANTWLPLLVQALPDVSPLIVDSGAVPLLRDEAKLALQPAGKEAAFSLINEARNFGSVSARERLLDEIGIDNRDDQAAARRLCVGIHEAGYSRSKLWTLHPNQKRIEPITMALIARNQNEFLVPTSIAADRLSGTQRNHLRIEELNPANLETMFEKDIAAIEQHGPDASEREAILEAGLSDGLLIRLPIHERQDGTVGDGKGIFRETEEWSVPEALRAVVSIVRPCQSQKALELQGRLIRAWSRENQIEVALRCDDPHRLRGEILDALVGMQSPLNECLLKELRAKSWLFADGHPVKPEDVLALPPEVDEAARALLLTDGQSPPFLPAARLAIDVREHDGFVNLEKWILPNRRSSFAALALMIVDARVVGRLGPADDYPIDDFTTLADAGSSLELPGWPLLAAVLTSVGDSREDAMETLAAFTSLDSTNPKLAGTHLDCLAALAAEQGRRGEAALRAYRHSFSVVAEWPERARREVFGRTRVPTEARNWRSGREVVQDGDGLDPTRVLARDFASMFDKDGPQHTKFANAKHEAHDFSPIDRLRGQIRDVDLAALDAQWADQHRSFLATWRGRVPSDLMIVYLGMIGRCEPFRRLANEWAIDATADVDTLWADLDNHFPKEVLYPNPLAAEVDQRRFLIKPVAGEHVQSVALSGVVIDVPLDASNKGLLIGNLHKCYEGIRAADGKVRSLITLAVRQVDPSGYGQKEASGIFRRFVETVAADCLWLGMNRQREALREMLDRAIEVDQSTIEETERLLRDKLPTILAELKLPTDYHTQKALRAYQAEESRLLHLSAPAQEIEALKAELWQKVSDGALGAELLSAVRNKIGDFGYSASRVLFELFQNADDAYRQHGQPGSDAHFRLEPLPGAPGGFRVVHWGRPINHMGHDAEEGRRIGHDRDLLNMLLMNFSEKRPGDDLTGKFGLGFKSVHVLSDGVGIASGFIALRTAGGFLPMPWPEGIDMAEGRKGPGGRKATVIEVPFSAETADKGAEATAAFKSAVTWLPAFARTIRRVEIEGDAPMSVECSSLPLLGESQVSVLSMSGGRRERALRFDLSSGFALLLHIGAAGPDRFPDYLNRLWNLAPLEVPSRSGWLLNGPFAVDPGRTGLAGSIDDQKETFRTLGRVFGDRLLKLHDCAEADWRGFAESLDLDASDASRTAAWTTFWTRLFNVIAPDFDDYLALHLHANGHGYGHLIGQRQVVPTNLPVPFASLVQASDVAHFVDGALSDATLLGKVRDWSAMTELRCQTIASKVAGQLKKLGFGNIRSIRLSDVLHKEMGSEKRVDVDLAMQLGQVLTLEGVEEEPLNQERQQILDAAGQAHFRAQDDSWRSVRDLSSEDAGSDDEKLHCGFAPESALLDRGYQKAALEFFKTARAQSGYGPQVSLLLRWAQNANCTYRHRAVLRYIVDGSQGRELAAKMRDDLPSWIPQPLEGLLADTLLEEWGEEDKKWLLILLGGHDLFSIATGSSSPVELGSDENEETPPDPLGELSRILDWWRWEHQEERRKYDDRVWPQGIRIGALGEVEAEADRLNWFTFFALGIFRTLGWNNQGAHKSFIDAAIRQGWWQEMAEARFTASALTERELSEAAMPWLKRLESFARPDKWRIDFLQWRRTLADLYALARWLPDYVEAFRLLPRVIERDGRIPLSDAWRPSASPVWQRRGLEGAPLSQSLGLGANWMIREAIRHGLWLDDEATRMPSYAWAATGPLRRLFEERLAKPLGKRGHMDLSPDIYDFVASHLGWDDALFLGDLDLPLQLWNGGGHEKADVSEYNDENLE